MALRRELLHYITVGVMEAVARADSVPAGDTYQLIHIARETDERTTKRNSTPRGVTSTCSVSLFAAINMFGLTGRCIAWKAGVDASDSAPVRDDDEAEGGMHCPSHFVL